MARVSGITRGVFPVLGTPSRKTVGERTTSVVPGSAGKEDYEGLRLVDRELAETANLSADDSRVLDGALCAVYDDTDLSDAEAAEVAYALIGQAMAADFGSVDISDDVMARIRKGRAS